jgi:probable DNA metabolism protein
LSQYSYDGTFPGLLTIVFLAYSSKDWPDAIIRPGKSGRLFGETIKVETDELKASRVWEGVKKNGGILTCEQLFHSFLSLDDDVEMIILNYCRELFTQKNCIATNFADDSVLRVSQLEKKVLCEAHRMVMFIRFEQAADGTWFAPITPKYDVLPLITGHFRLRFTDQPWLIYDTKRGYGFYFDTKQMEQITIDNPTFNITSGQLNSEVTHPDEDKWQEMWKTYFKQIAIRERTNLKCQQNFMPKRFWKYLTEKKL